MYCLNFCFLCFKEVNRGSHSVLAHTVVVAVDWSSIRSQTSLRRRCHSDDMSMTVSCKMCTSFPNVDISRDLFGSGWNTKQKQKAKYLLCIGMKRKRSGSLPSMGNNKAQFLQFCQKQIFVSICCIFSWKKFKSFMVRTNLKTRLALHYTI